jgi:hypothetical protein
MLRNSTSMAQNASYHATDEFITTTYVMPILWDDAKRAEITEEHRLNPIGRPGKGGTPASRHSEDLARVLDKLRRAPLTEKMIRVELVPFTKYAIGILSGKRGEPVKLLEPTYATGDECEHAIFLMRVEAILKKYPKPAS